MTDSLGMAPHPRGPRPELKARVLERAFGSGGPVPWRLAAAALFVLVMGGGVWSAAMLKRVRVQRDWLAARVTALEDTLDLIRSPATRVVQIPVTTSGRVGAVTIFADNAQRRWLVACHGLAPNTPSQAYQIWFITETGMTRAAVMPMDQDRPMWMALDLPADSVHVMGVAMSIEARAGSAEPKGPMVFHVQL